MTSPQKPPHSAITITGVGISCATGTVPAALFGAVAGNLCCARPIEGLLVSAGSAPACPPLSATIRDIPAEIEPPQRISLLVQEALYQACLSLKNINASSQLLIVTLLPADACSSSSPQQISLEAIDMLIAQAHPLTKNATRRTHAIHQGGVIELASVLDEFSQGSWDAILFGGVDCLTGQRTLLNLAEKGRCFSESFPEGIIPGEAAAYIVLTQSDTLTFPRIKSIGHATEQHSGQALHQEMTGLASAISNTLKSEGTTAPEVDCIISSYPGDADKCIEWYQTQQKVWGDTQLSFNAEELNLHPTLGDTGTANLPLSLALAWQRFSFNFPTVENVLICETGETIYRGAVWLQKKRSTRKTEINKGQGVHRG